MNIPFKFRNIHTCDAVVLTCIDFRFWRETLEFMEKELSLSAFDFPSLPGAAKAINESAENDVSMQCISVPCELHHAKKIVIVNHEDCGAYGGSKEHETQEAEQKFHEEELKKAEAKLKEKYPDKEYILIYAKLDGGKENIEFVRI